MVLCPSRRCCFVIYLLLLNAPSAAVAGFQFGGRWSNPSTMVPNVLGPAVFSSRLEQQLHYQKKHHHHHVRSQRASTTTRRTHGSAVLLNSALVTAVDTFFQSYPYAAAALTCGVKASTADWVAQKRSYRKRDEKEALLQQSKRVETSSSSISTTQKAGGGGGVAVALPAPTSSPPTTDLKRNVAFLLYGAVYQGMAQEFIYNHLYPVMFGSGTTIVIVLSKVLFDLLVQTTLVTLPIAYLTKAIIYRYSAKEAMRRYRDDILNHGLLKKYFLLWGPVQCITFSVVPEHYRVTFIACISFFWLIILSTIASRTSIPVKKTPKLEIAATTTTVEDELSLSQSMAIVTENMQDVEDEEDIPECEFVDGLTCNVDG